MRTLAVFALMGLVGCTASGVIALDDGVDEPEPEPEPDPVSEFAGNWAGELVLVVDFGRGPNDLCVGEIDVDLDDEGGFITETVCPLQFGGGGGGQAYYDVIIEGGVDDDGVLAASSTWTRSSEWIADLDDTQIDGEAELASAQGFGLMTVAAFGQQFDGELVLNLAR